MFQWRRSQIARYDQHHNLYVNRKGHNFPPISFSLAAVSADEEYYGNFDPGQRHPGRSLWLTQGDVVKVSPGAKIAAANDEHNGADGEVNIGGD